MPAPVRLLVTSIVRHARSDQKSGFARIVDLSSGKVVMKALVPESDFRSSDPNPRGGFRGARGVAVRSDRVLIANAERILVFDRSWKRTGALSHPLAGGIHDILTDDEGVWVTCTSADLLVKLDWTGRLTREWEWRKDDRLVRSLGFGRVPAVDRRIDYRDPDTSRSGVPNIVHLNSVGYGSDGLLVSLGRILSAAAYRKARAASVLGRVAKAAGLSRRRQPSAPPEGAGPPVSAIEGSSSAVVLVHHAGHGEILTRIRGTTLPNHNVAQAGDVLLYNDSNGGRLVALPLDRTGPERSVQIPGRPAFARGLVLLNRRTAVVGSTWPAAVYEIDLEEMRVVSSVPLGGEPTEAVHAICVLPDSFGDPPMALE